jgi:hypothetical protein
VLSYRGILKAAMLEKDQRLFLSTLARHFQELVNTALNAHYSSHALFEEKQELRLITYVINLTEMFSYNLEQEGTSVLLRYLGQAMRSLPKTRSATAGPGRIFSKILISTSSPSSKTSSARTATSIVLSPALWIGLNNFTYDLVV